MKIKKILKNKIIDCNREIIQILILSLCFFLPWITDEMIITILKDKLINENIVYFILLSWNKEIIGFIFMCFILIKYFRSWNKEVILNKGNIYHNHSYYWYLFCSKILGYDKCDLILVPLYMQFKLVLNDVFKEYPFDKNLFPEEEYEIEVNKKIKNIENKKVTFILEDTYPIDNKMIPNSFIENNTIKIKIKSKKIGKRIYSEKFIDAIIEILRELPNETILNIFATTNPKHTYNIIKKGITSGERSNIKNLYVFQQQATEDRKFTNKAYKIL